MPCWLTTAVPLISNRALEISPLWVSGVTTMLNEGRLPPFGKKASRISWACWNWRRVTGERSRATLLSGRQVQGVLDWSTKGARCWVKNLSMMPLGANNRAKSASATSR